MMLLCRHDMSIVKIQITVAKLKSSSKFEQIEEHFLYVSHRFHDPVNSKSTHKEYTSCVFIMYTQVLYKVYCYNKTMKTSSIIKSCNQTCVSELRYDKIFRLEFRSHYNINLTEKV